ncbi:MAG: fluoride efflux transporter CrcB [Cyanobacteria bacterium QS_8_64_29]|nr:MAG: fluoride efflux transporter CrcB [Cyanobacteria bacterium QS_8_64_29]
MPLDPAWRPPLAIALGAAAGALSRHYLTLWFAQRLGGSFPYGTAAVNLSGCLAMGLLVAAALVRTNDIAPELRLLVGTGFLGAYTTFSSYELESLALWRDRGAVIAGCYWLGSATLGAVGVRLGMLLGRLLG